MSKTDSVAVLRERQINELVKLADDVWHQRIEQEDIRGLVALILDLKPDAALSAQGEAYGYAFEKMHVTQYADAAGGSTAPSSGGLTPAPPIRASWSRKGGRVMSAPSTSTPPRMTRMR